MAVQGPSNPLSFWKEISQDPSSGVRLVHHKLHLSFPPYYLADLKKSVKSVVDARLIRYEQELGGILAGYGRIAILKSEAETLFNLSDVHVDVEGDFYVFSPEVGKQLTGVVNRKSHGHLGCLVHGLFNVSLPKPYTVNAEDWLGRSAKLADEVNFTVTKVDLQSQVPYIEGDILEVLSTNKPDESTALKERSGSDSGVSSEDHLAADASVDGTSESEDNEMDKKPSKLSLTQRKKEALLSAGIGSPKLNTALSKTKPDRVRQISDSEDSNLSSAAMGESLRLEMSEEIGNASEKSSDSDFDLRSPKSKSVKNSRQRSSPSPSKKIKKSLKVIESSSDSEADDTAEARTPSFKVKTVPTKASHPMIETPVSQKTKKGTPKSGKKAIETANHATTNGKAITSNKSPERESALTSPSKSKKRKRGDDSTVRESPKSKKAKTNRIVDEDDDADVDDLVSNLFAAMSKKNTESQPGAESTPKSKKAKKVATTQEKEDSQNISISSELASQLIKEMQPKKNTPKIAKKGKLANTSVLADSTPKKATDSPTKLKTEPDLDATILKIVDNYLSESEKPKGSEPVEVDTPSKGKEKKKKAQQQEASQTPVAKSEVKESKSSLSASKKKVKQAESDSGKQDLDSDEGVDVSGTPISKSKKLKYEKTSTPTVKVAKPIAESNVIATPLPTSMNSLQGVTPIKPHDTSVTKQSAKKKATAGSVQQHTTPARKAEKADEHKNDDDDAELIIQELLQKSIRASPAVGTPKRKTNVTPSQPKGDASRRIQSSIKKKTETDDASKNKRHSLQPGRAKKLKMEDDKDPHEQTILKILQAVQPKERKIKASK